MEKDIKFVRSLEKGFEDYYDIAALSPEDFTFLSPSNFPDWCSKTAKWLCEGKRIGEIGTGKGELAHLTASYANKELYFLLIDISSKMLDVTCQKVEKLEKSFITIKCFNLDISKKLPKLLFNHNLDKLIAVNTLQDAEPLNSLLNMKLLLKQGGEIRLTFISKETQDEFSKEDYNYNSLQGIWYASSSFHEGKEASPLGYIKDREGNEKPFYRINRFYTRSDACQLLENAGFKVKSVEPVIYPLDYLWKRWKSRYHSINLTEKQLKLIESWGGYPDGWDIIATAI